MFSDCTFYADLTCTALWVFLFLGIYLGWENVRYLNSDYIITTGFFKRFRLNDLNWWRSKNSGIALTHLEIKNAPKYRWSAVARLLTKLLLIALIVCGATTPQSIFTGFMSCIWFLIFCCVIVFILFIVFCSTCFLFTCLGFPKKAILSFWQDVKLIFGK